MSEKIDSPFIRTITSNEIDGGLNPREYYQGDLADDVWEMLSSDISHEIVAWLIEVEIATGQWFCVSSNPTEWYGFDPENKDPMYCTMFQGKPYLYVPFSIIMESKTIDGEITKTQLSIANTDFKMVQAIYDKPEAISFKVKLVRVSDGYILEKNDYLKLLSPVFTDRQIFGTLGGYSKLAEQLPTERYLPSIFAGQK